VLDQASAVDRQRGVEVTLEFPDSARISGVASCNRYFGPVVLDGNSLRIGPLTTTTQVCAEAILIRERDFIDALENATRYSISGPFLTIYVSGRELPLRFSRVGG
jgi:heat shock protein HslJ